MEQREAEDTLGLSETWGGGLVTEATEARKQTEKGTTETNGALGKGRQVYLLSLIDAEHSGLVSRILPEIVHGYVQGIYTALGWVG